MKSQRIFTKTFVLGAISLFVLALGPAEAGAGQRTFKGSPSQVGPAVPQAPVIQRAPSQIPAVPIRQAVKPPNVDVPVHKARRSGGDYSLETTWVEESKEGIMLGSEVFMPKSTQMSVPGGGGTPSEFMPKGAAPAGLISPETMPTPGAAARGININTYRGLQVIDTKPGQGDGGQGFIMKKAPLTYIPATAGQEGGSPVPKLPETPKFGKVDDPFMPQKVKEETFGGPDLAQGDKGAEGDVGQAFIMKKAPLTYIPAAPGQEGGSPGGDRLFKISESAMPKGPSANSPVGIGLLDIPEVTGSKGSNVSERYVRQPSSPTHTTPAKKDDDDD